MNMNGNNKMLFGGVLKFSILFIQFKYYSFNFNLFQLTLIIRNIFYDAVSK